MYDKLREALDTIDEMLAGEDEMFSKDLWNVLTALRGPDTCTHPEDPKKLATTSVIRGVAFPRAAEKGVGGAFYEKDSRVHQGVRRSLVTNVSLPGHFRAHAWSAFASLGIDF